MVRDITQTKTKDITNTQIISIVKKSSIHLSYETYYFNERTVFFSHSKLANSTFSHDLLAKRTWLISYVIHINVEDTSQIHKLFLYLSKSKYFGDVAHINIKDTSQNAQIILWLSKAKYYKTRHRGTIFLWLSKVKCFGTHTNVEDTS